MLAKDNDVLTNLWTTLLLVFLLTKLTLEFGIKFKTSLHFVKMIWTSVKLLLHPIRSSTPDLPSTSMVISCKPSSLIQRIPSSKAHDSATFEWQIHVRSLLSSCFDYRGGTNLHQKQLLSWKIAALAIQFQLILTSRLIFIIFMMGLIGLPRGDDNA